MEPSPQKFAELLSAAIRQISKAEQRKIRAIQDELGIELNYSGGAMIEYWRKREHVPPLDKVIALAAILRRRARLDQAWVEEFFTSAGYAGRAALIAEGLVGEPTPAAPPPNPPTASLALPVTPPVEPAPFTAQPGTEQDHEPRRGGADLSWSEQHQAAHEQRNRTTLLQRVRTFWIQNVLEEALTGRPPLLLPLLMAPAAVEPGLEGSPLGAKAEQPLSAAALIDSYEAQPQQALLLLGEPGAGKTTLLLLLAQRLLQKAEADLLQPLPVIFNVATWSAKGQPLEEWLIDELQSRYHIPKPIGHCWVADDDLALLLDGLDEVAPPARAACVAAINAFRDEHLAPLVVCCRTAVYEALPERLAFDAVVIVQPLAPAQVEAYLAQSDATGTLGQQIQADEALRALSRIPLLLNLMTATYQETPLSQPEGPASLAERSHQLLTAYLTRTTIRHADATLFAQTQSLHWLGWLARQVKIHAAHPFTVEMLQPSWLEYAWQRAAYAAWAALIGGLTYWLMVGLVFGATNGLVAALFGAALFLVRTKAELAEIKPAVVLRWSWVAGRTGLLGGLIFGALAGLGGALSFWLVFGLIGGQSLGIFSKLLLRTRDERRYTANHELLIGLVGSVIVGAWYGLGAGLLVGAVGVIIYCTCWRAKPYPTWVSYASGLLCGVIGACLGEASRTLHLQLQDLVAPGISDGLVRGLLLTWSHGRGAVVGGLCAGLLLGLFGGLLGGLVYRATMEHDHRPHQGIEQSGRNALTVGGGLMVLAAVAFFLVNQLVAGLLTWWQAAVSFGLLGGLSYGGFAYLLHYGLRAILWASGSIPWCYVAFLDHSAAQLLFYKVGRDYIFIHHLLLEHLITLQATDTEATLRTNRRSSPAIPRQASLLTP